MRIRSILPGRASLFHIFISILSLWSFQSSDALHSPGASSGWGGLALRSRSAQPEATPLRLRGGWWKNILCCMGQPVNQQVAGSEAAEAETQNSKKKKARIGRMERSVEIDAPINKVFRVCSGYEHYQDWTGNGIKSVHIKERTPGLVHAQYTTGVFGITFHFEMYWSHSAPTKITFRNVGQTKLIKLLKGEYTLTEVSKTRTKVHFLVIADIRGPIPHIVKVAIAKLLVHIALDDLKTYVESPKCDIDLAKYDKESHVLHTLHRHITRMYTEVPDLVKTPGGLQKLLSGAARTAAVALLMSRLFLR